MAIDALAASLVGGLADTGAAAGAAFGAADLGAATAADVSLGALGAADVGAATVPEFAAADAGAAGLSAADATFGTFSPDLFAANSADVAAGGFGTDLGAAGLDAGSAAANLGAADLSAGGSGVLADTSGLSSFFGGTGSDLFSGEGLGTSGFGDIGGTSTFQPFGDTFSADATAGAQGGGAGTFGGGTAGGGAGGAAPGSWADFAPGVGENTGGGIQGFGAATQDSGPIVSSNEGIVGSEGLQGGATGANQSMGDLLTGTPGYSTQEGFVQGAGPLGPSDTLGGGSNIADIGNLGTGNITNVATTTPASFSNPIAGDFSTLEAAGANTTATPYSPAALLGQPTTAPALPAATEVGPGVTAANPTIAPLSGPFTDSGFGPVASTPAAPLGAPTTVPAAPGATAGLPADTVPAAGAPATGSSVPATTAAGGGTSALNALRMGAAGASILSSGINIANALNQPSYSALQPIMYPGSPMASYAGPYSGQTPLGEGGMPGTGGIAGGLAANRLTNGLVSGASPQQLAASGLISPQRATQLQADYTGITQAYARELGVSPQSLSPGIREMIAARALADNGLGGR